jgi:hypothetical protein
VYEKPNPSPGPAAYSPDFRKTSVNPPAVSIGVRAPGAARQLTRPVDLRKFVCSRVSRRPVPATDSAFHTPGGPSA